MIECPKCRGTGYIDHENAGRVDSVPCPDCSGTGDPFVLRDRCGEEPDKSWFSADAHQRRLDAVAEFQKSPKQNQHHCAFCDTPLIRAVETSGVCANCEMSFTKLVDSFDTIECLRAKGWVIQLDNGLDGTWEAQASKPERDTQYSPGNTFEDAVAGVAVKVLKAEQ